MDFVKENSGFKRESIGDGVNIFVSHAHTFGTDAVLLADFAAPKKSDTAADLGSGCGIIPFLWARRDYPKEICAVEIKEDGCCLMEKSVNENSFTGRITVVNADIREIDKKFYDSFSLVTMNPPYKPVGTGIRNASSPLDSARHELCCTLDDAAHCAQKLLKFGGRFCICLKPERLADILCCFRERGLEPKRLRFVVNRAGEEPWLVLAEGRKGGGKGLRILPELVMRDEKGEYSKEMKTIYGNYGDRTK